MNQAHEGRQAKGSLGGFAEDATHDSCFIMNRNVIAFGAAVLLSAVHAAVQTNLTDATNAPVPVLEMERMPDDGGGDLGAKLQNPVGSIYSVPVETTWDCSAPECTRMWTLQFVFPKKSIHGTPPLKRQ